MKVLIFTVSAGNGHNSCARYVKEKFQLENADAEIKIVDAFKQYTSKLRAWTFEQGYFLLCKHAVELHNYFFKISERNDVKNANKNGAVKIAHGFEYGMLKTIDEFKPDLVIPTHAYCAIALNNIKKHYNLPCKIAAITLDYGVSPFWGSCSDNLDFMFLTNDGMIPEFLKRGFCRDQLFIAGVPISANFRPASDKTALRKSLGLLPDVWTVTVMKASFFHVPLKKLVEQLFATDGNCQIVIINGRDERSKNRIDRLVKRQKGDKTVINLTYTSAVDEYLQASDLVIGKGGGLSTTEAVNTGVPQLIIDKIPQQEIYNKQYWIDCGCALSVTKNTIAANVNKLKNDENFYNSMRANALAQRKENVIDEIYSVLSAVPHADYGDWHFCDTKRQTVANIKRAIKAQLAKK